MAKTPAPVTEEAIPAIGPTADEQIKALHEALNEQRELSELWERRYNQEHQRGLQLELAGQKAEKLAGALQAENEQLRSTMTEEKTSG